MVTTSRKSESDMIPHYRVSIKANGIVIWEIESESGISYHTTWYDGKVTSCEQANGEPCKGWRYRKDGKVCHHAQLVTRLEAARAAALEAERIVQESRKEEERPTSEKGSLHSSRAFSLLR